MTDMTHAAVRTLIRGASMRTWQTALRGVASNWTLLEYSKKNACWVGEGACAGGMDQDGGPVGTPGRW
jgi:hypothetical protein